ncbi:MAG: polysaccharide biosynthesis protein, partial [Phycisphaerales bacterium]|nr:polysaccharide biosynthesis protein [Phycisphaerales bacterium]
DFGPKRLVLMERSENALFEIDRRLGRRLPSVERRAVLHDVVDRDRTRRILEQERPDVVFHAAAHKHVPLMEDHPAHAIANNFQGTRSIVDASLAAGASHFVLISTDKAVQPTSVMGATKRLAEFYVHMRQAPGTKFAIVRFGNVIGSAGSVLPIWAQQIAEGGPLTITDSRMTRYFMTIPEAASLVMQAASMATEEPAVFVLDMGDPISIADLARRLVRACGCTPVDRRATPDSGEIEIAVTGIRPGEKLHEALSYEEEHLLPTDHPSIRVHRDAMLKLPDFASLAADLEMLGPESSRARVLEVLTRHVPGARLGQQEPGADRS